MASIFTNKELCSICHRAKEQLVYAVDSPDGTSVQRVATLCNRCDGNENIPRLRKED